MSDREKAISAFCKLRRLQEASNLGYVRCVTCGRVMRWTQCDGGHMVPRRFRGTEVEHDNVWPQCVVCNRFGNISQEEYERTLVGLIGQDRVAAVLARKDMYERKDYSLLKKQYEASIRSIRKEKGL